MALVLGKQTDARLQNSSCTCKKDRHKKDANTGCPSVSRSRASPYSNWPMHACNTIGTPCCDNATRRRGMHGPTLRVTPGPQFRTPSFSATARSGQCRGRRRGLSHQQRAHIPRTYQIRFQGPSLRRIGVNRQNTGGEKGRALLSTRTSAQRITPHENEGREAECSGEKEKTSNAL